MRELGQLLKNKRVQLGIGLEEVEAKTKIRKRYLLAVENGDWGVLPGEVYARGFVRSYAELLGLDGIELLKKYGTTEREFSTAPEVPAVEVGQKPVRPVDDTPIDVASLSGDPTVTRRRAAGQERVMPGERAPAQRVKPRIRAGGLGGVGQVAVVTGILIVLGGGIYLSRSGKQASQGAHLNQPYAGSPANSVAVTQNANASHTNNTLGNSTANASVGSLTNNTTATTPVSATTVTVGTLQGGLQSYTVHTTGTMNVELKAVSGNCWVQVTADGAVIDSSSTIVAGQSKTWPANQILQMNVGNVGAVTMSVNGSPVTLPTVNGAIHVQFTKTSS